MPSDDEMVESPNPDMDQSQPNDPVLDDVQLKAEKEKSPSLPLRKIMAMVPCAYMMLMIGLIFAFLNGISLPVFSVVFGELFNSFFDFIANDDADELNDDLRQTSLTFVGLMIYTIIVAFIQSVAFGYLGEKSVNQLRFRYFHSLLHQDPGFFDETGGVGVFTDRLSKDVVQIQNAIEKIGNLCQNFSTMFAGVIVAFVFSWKLALVILSVSPLIVISGALENYFLNLANTKGASSANLSSKIPREAIGGLRTITSLNMQNRLIRIYEDVLFNLKWVGFKKALINGFTIGLSFFLIFGVYALGFWYGGTLIEDGDIEPGDVLIVFFAIIIGFQGLGQAAGLGNDFSTAAVTASEIFKVLERNPEIKIVDPEKKKLKKLRGNIEFRDISFSYPTRPQFRALRKFNLSVKAGEAVALVGPSGGGKSTVISLLERFYKPQEGSIFFEGVDVNDIDLQWLRDNIALVSQEPVLFSGTIRENIAYARPSATFEEIQAAARHANADKFIKKQPKGFDTPVGESGSKLSGGQKQRIAIARAILKDPKILLLDEATSALDNRSERKVQEALEKLMKKRTTFIIAHRLTTIVNATKIVVIKKGAVVEIGNHQTLLEKNGIYAGLFQRQ